MRLPALVAQVRHARRRDRRGVEDARRVRGTAPAAARAAAGAQGRRGGGRHGDRQGARRHGEDPAADRGQARDARGGRAARGGRPAGRRRPAASAAISSGSATVEPGSADGRRGDGRADRRGRAVGRGQRRRRPVPSEPAPPPRKLLGPVRSGARGSASRGSTARSTARGPSSSGARARSRRSWRSCCRHSAGRHAASRGKPRHDAPVPGKDPKQGPWSTTGATARAGRSSRPSSAIAACSCAARSSRWPASWPRRATRSTRSCGARCAARRARRSARRLATPQWQQAVRAAQHLTGRPVTGELDGDLTRLLAPFWPRDNAAKRAIRSTPAWRTIPGQLTPNFNVKEFHCKDAHRTPYVEGLMREQGLTQEGGARPREGAGDAARARPQGRRRPAADHHLGVPDEGLQRLADGLGDELRPHARLRGRHAAAAGDLARPAPQARAGGVRVRRRLLPARPRLLHPRRLRPHAGRAPHLARLTGASGGALEHPARQRLRQLGRGRRGAQERLVEHDRAGDLGDRHAVLGAVGDRRPRRRPRARPR